MFTCNNQTTTFLLFITRYNLNTPLSFHTFFSAFHSFTNCSLSLTLHFLHYLWLPWDHSSKLQASVGVKPELRHVSTSASRGAIQAELTMFARISMKPNSQRSCAFAVAVLVASINHCDARPHAHGVLDSLRRFIHPSSTGVNNVNAPALGASPCGKRLKMCALDISNADLTSSTRSGFDHHPNYSD